MKEERERERERESKARVALLLPHTFACVELSGVEPSPEPAKSARENTSEHEGRRTRERLINAQIVSKGRQSSEKRESPPMEKNLIRWGPGLEAQLSFAVAEERAVVSVSVCSGGFSLSLSLSLYPENEEHRKHGNNGQDARAIT